MREGWILRDNLASESHGIRAIVRHGERFEEVTVLGPAQSVEKIPGLRLPGTIPFVTSY
jgi:hypothetical protein